MLRRRRKSLCDGTEVCAKAADKDPMSTTTHDDDHDNSATRTTTAAQVEKMPTATATPRFSATQYPILEILPWWALPQSDRAASSKVAQLDEEIPLHFAVFQQPVFVITKKQESKFRSSFQVDNLR